jgi:guanylate kinase
LLLPPSLEELENRMKKRGDKPEKIKQRITMANQEIKQGQELAHYTVINQDLDRCVKEIADIIREVRKNLRGDNDNTI